jgi:hypothetical protein
MKSFGLTSLVFVLLWAIIYALPVTHQRPSSTVGSSSKTNDKEIITNSNNNNSEVRPDCNDSTDPAEYNVHLDQLIQHITTHWKFDHLDSIQTQSYKQIASQVQQHVEIKVTTMSSSSSSQQVVINPADTMDVDILMAQIFGAIQSHTQGKLPLEWDKLGDQLGKPALEAYLRKIVLDQCGSVSNDTSGAHIISAQCLVDYSDQLSSQLDRYLGTHLIHIFDTMDRHVLPDLLATTSENLQGILNYFNSVFFNKDDQALLLQVHPWQGSIKDTYINHILPSLNKNNDLSSHFFTRYTCLARV